MIYDLEDDWHLYTFTFWLGWGCTVVPLFLGGLVMFAQHHPKKRLAMGACATCILLMFIRQTCILANPVSPFGFGVGKNTCHLTPC